MPREDKKRLYRQRVADGICTKCGKESASSNTKKCLTCHQYEANSRNAEKDKIRRSNVRNSRKKEGLCISCGNRSPADGLTKCDECRRKQNQSTSEKRSKRHENGICVRCGINKPYGTYKICQECRSKEAAIKREKYIEQGLCKNCGANPIRHDETVICQKCFERNKKNRQKRNQNNWRLILDHYGRKCANCNEDNVEFLTIDHVGDDGAEHRRKIGRGSDVLKKWVVKNNFPDTIQILCYNCNCSKNRGTC